MSLEVINKINTSPTTLAEMGQTLEQVKSVLIDLKANPGNPGDHEKFVKLAGEMEAAQAHLLKHEKELTLAMELAKDAARSPIGAGHSLNLKRIPMEHKATEGSEISAMFGNNRAFLNLMLVSKHELRLAGVGEPEVAAVERLQYLGSQIAVMHAIMMESGSANRQAYLSRGAHRSLPLWDEWVELSRTFRAAMDTAEAGAGAEWVPTGINLQLIPDVRPEHMTRAQFQTYSMTRSPQLFPVQGTSFRAFKLAESTAVHRSATAIGQRRSATANVTFTAVKFGALTDYSRELLQDSIVAMATAVRVDHAYAHGETDESTIWNGQKGTTGVGMGGADNAASLFDTGVTFDITTQAVDDRAAFDGIRLLYNSGSCTTPGDAGAGLVADLFTDQFGAMGKFGYSPADTFIGTSFVGAAKLMVLKDSANQNVTLTAEKAGGPGAFGVGIQLQAFGRNVVASTQYPQTLNSSGIVDGSSTKTGYHIVAKNRFGVGEVQALEIAASDQVAFDTDQIVVRSIARKQFKAYVAPNSTTETSIGAIFNV